MTLPQLSRRMPEPSASGHNGGGASLNVCAGSALATVVRRGIEVSGVVQGVGFRPFVAALAGELGLAGSTLNHAEGVHIEVEGPAEQVAAFERRVVVDAPPLARVVGCTTTELLPLGDDGFRIGPSVAAPGERTLVPPDTAVCKDCLRELTDPADRRHRHPFITCTNCGPRLTIITDIPYDRPATTMAGFAMCAACSAEYADPADRRHHAQPIACHDCGPTLTLRDPAGLPVARAEEAIAAVQDSLAAGQIVAIKGIGGFHLACDAASDDAVHSLRERKRRPDKPFALMVADVDVAGLLVDLDEAGRAALAGPDRPILLAPVRAITDTGVAPVLPRISAEVAPGLDELGVMLPYAPLHHLLFAPHPATGRSSPPALVMTSGNLSDEPLAYEDDDALVRLGGLADLFLTHDRAIHVPVEDSIVTVADGEVIPIRRSRGHAPLPVRLPHVDAAPVILAVGAEIKNTFCLARQDWAFCSAHIGDMGSLESQAAFGDSVDQLLTLHDTRPTALAADLHPGYSTRRWAERRSEADGIPLHGVQHHHAHLASLLAEHGRLDDTVLGIAFDGTGYGCDTTIWGGELLLSPGDPTAIERVGNLSPFALPGGEIAVRRPIRIGLALLHAAGRSDRSGVIWPGSDRAEIALVTSQLEHGGQPMTTSLGRLWDGLAALLGVRTVVTYEAQAAIELEVLARTATTSYAVPLGFVTDPNGLRVLDVTALVRAVVDARTEGVERAAIARGIHDAVIAGVTAAVSDLAGDRSVATVGLTGGAFQNRLLATGLRDALQDNGLDVITHRVVPANDGGLALGQAAIARALITKGAR